ncbi:MAG: hypothetical protein E7K04_03270 [Helicobacter sp.]|nr:hypothetical protein [Helicobacter sp.]
MLYSYLFGAIKDLEQLIELTKLDITDIKSAKHEALFCRNEQKTPLINAFESKKDLAEQEILILKNKSQNKNAQISEILDEQTNSMLLEMKQKLCELKEVNANYARMVLNVSEFYTSLLDHMFPHDFDDYSRSGAVRSKRAKSAFLYQQV